MAGAVGTERSLLRGGYVRWAGFFCNSCDWHVATAGRERLIRSSIILVWLPVLIGVGRNG
jgi:hypothetical protein